MLEPSKGLFQAAKAMFHDIWDARLALAGEATKTLQTDLKKIDRQIETMLDRIVDSNTGSVVAAYEKRIAKGLLINN